MESVAETSATRSRGGRPRGDTRERILDVAMELFNEQGYDKTSLREIADRLGFTKAALYYHFTRKEDILLALHLRLHDLGSGLIDALAGLDDPERVVELWPRLLDTTIDTVVENRDLFVLHQRNHNALELIGDNEEHAAQHDDLEARVRRVLADPAIPLAVRVRLGFAFVAVMGTMMAGADLFDADPADVAEQVRAAVHDLLGPP